MNVAYFIYVGKYIENDMFAWHHRAPDDSEFQKFIKEINEK